MRAVQRIGVIELFAGAAGLAQGFLRTKKYDALALFDIMQAAHDSYKKRYPRAKYEQSDIKTLSTQRIRELVGKRQIHGVLGGPPCQGFSLAGSKNPNSDKNELVGRYVAIVKEMRPDFLLMENVPQLLYHEQFTRLQDELSHDYHIVYAILNAAQYGTPQTRHRLFVLAYHKNLGVKPTLPKPTHGKLGQNVFGYRSKCNLVLSEETADEILGADPVIARERRLHVELAPITLDEHLLPLVTVQDAISDLCDIRPSVNFRSNTKPVHPPQNFAAISCIPNHISRKHIGVPLDIVRVMPEGGDMEDVRSKIPSFADKSYYSQAYSRLHRQGLARTLTTYFQNAGSGRFYHYAKERTLTIREAARLQGFDDSFEFCGSLADQMQLVGNAVPLPLAETLGHHIFTEIGGHLASTPLSG